MINDVLDAEADRAHADKRDRPVAAGVVTPRLAVGAAAILAILAIALPLLLRNGALAVIIGTYLVLQAAYVIQLKHMAVLDVATIASGFLLRAIAGGIASGLPISNSFLIVVGFGALFMALGKRYSEQLTHHDQDETSTRATLEEYTPGYLRMMLAVTAAVTLVAYTLWAFEIATHHTGPFPLSALSVIPFTLALMRYARDIDTGDAEAPEDILLKDPTLLILGVVWVGLFVGQVAQR